MIPITQTRTGLTGNCFEACLASILHIPLHVIPEFADGDRFLGELSDFLAPYGLYYVQVSPDDPILARMFEHGEAWHTMEGISERGGLHACVGCNGVLIHDPHPGGNGLKSVESFGLFCERMNSIPS